MHIVMPFRHTIKRTFLVLLGTTIMGSGIVSIAVSSDVAAASCNNNYVVHCGVAAASDLQHTYTTDQFVQHVYAYFGITNSDINALGTTMVQGTVTKTGNVLVNGQTVATNASTAGRDNITGSTKVTYQGSTFYKRPPSVSFAQDSLSAWVVMKNNQFAFAILPSCGNPVIATAVKPKPQPSATCKQLTVTQKGNTITATVVSTTQNGATYTSTLYDFGDSNTLNTSHTTVTHTYAQPGTYHITAKQTFSTGTESSVQPGCQQSITIAAPKPKPAAPTSLPNTGAGSTGAMVGIFAGTTILGTTLYRRHLLRKQ
ncbi:MAG TPA: PKD domain-containing protein [Candidatus Saccharimonadales bacterium]|nr:PKD domain-containing protein [Candidatus Saccharimonadales bacterium]